jgi:uncharacterized protein YndB with AHSA1/START domain
MAVKKEADGRRWVASEVEVPGTPEQVWKAIATGAGISSWFAPTEVEERAGGKMVFHMMPGMDSTATITAWDPPRRLAAEDPGWAPGMPPVATEWTIEARAGGKCLVRVVHSLFASTDDWDGQLEGTETGWPGFFRILRLYLTHYRGQRCSPIQVMAPVAASEAEAWKKMSAALGLAGASIGQRLAAPAGAPPFAGTVEHTAEGKDQHMVLVRLEQPAPGAVTLGTFDCGGMVMASVGFYLYGEPAAAVAQRDAPRWQEWINQQFPAPSEASAAGTGSD